MRRYGEAGGLRDGSTMAKSVEVIAMGLGLEGRVFKLR